MNIIDAGILDDFRMNRNKYEKLEDVVYRKLAAMIEENSFFVMDISHRTKSIESLEGKIRKKSGRYKALSDITDLCGFRVICYFSDDVDKIGDTIRQLFAIDEDNSVDKRAVLNATQFGYMSLHYICYLPSGKEYDEDICNLKFEIQLRTVLQHTWAEIEHDLGYKSDFGVPRAIRREFSRIAGLLEIADLQFIELRDDTREYTAQTREKIIAGDADDVLIDRVSLNEYVFHNEAMTKLLEKIAAVTGAEIEYINPGAYLDQLEFFGLETIGDLSRFLQENQELAYTLAARIMEMAELDITSSNIALRYLCRAELIRKRYPEDQIRRFMEISITNEKEIERQIQRISELQEKIIEDNKTE